ncbi:MAG: hypothetical protein RLZZ227_123 [Pseudomonadota bacterium]|jgi:EAL domain-containing protein (putative c-di-GMP-specific phosphodiesterase class I)
MDSCCRRREGVEHAAQLEFLRDNGCDACQGFHFSDALPIDEAVALAQTWPFQRNIDLN